MTFWKNMGSSAPETPGGAWTNCSFRSWSCEPGDGFRDEADRRRKGLKGNQYGYQGVISEGTPNGLDLRILIEKKQGWTWFLIDLKSYVKLEAPKIGKCQIMMARFHRACKVPYDAYLDSECWRNWKNFNSPNTTVDGRNPAPPGMYKNW